MVFKLHIYKNYTKYIFRAYYEHISKNILHQICKIYSIFCLYIKKKLEYNIKCTSAFCYILYAIYNTMHHTTIISTHIFIGQNIYGHCKFVLWNFGIVRKPSLYLFIMGLFYNGVRIHCKSVQISYPDLFRFTDPHCRSIQSSKSFVEYNRALGILKPVPDRKKYSLLLYS